VWVTVHCQDEVSGVIKAFGSDTATPLIGMFLVKCMIGTMCVWGAGVHDRA
jgi:hypothetical protein